MESEGQSGATPEAGAESQQYGVWLTRTLGPDWVEVAPGIFQPPEDRAPQAEPEPHAQAPSLDSALWPTKREPEAPEPKEHTPSRRGWFRR